MSFPSVEQLEEFLSRPSLADMQSLGRLRGDLVVVGAAGKMGPSLARRARRALDQVGSRAQVFAVARFSSGSSRDELEWVGVKTIAADLMDASAVAALPDAAAVIYLAGRKFGSRGDESLTWASNCLLPSRVVERYRTVPFIALSSGNIYPFVPVTSRGCTESDPPGPVGEYAQSVLGRERIVAYHSRRDRTPVAIVRLNYATDCRYGVPVDLAQKVLAGEPIDLTMGHFNVVWQGDANSVCLRLWEHCTTPPRVVNLTGRETVSVRWLAGEFGRRFGLTPTLVGEEAPTALLNDASAVWSLLGPPDVSLERIVAWTADWLRSGQGTLGKPTRFEVRDGQF